jgi:hypothetical protein
VELPTVVVALLETELLGHLLLGGLVCLDIQLVQDGEGGLHSDFLSIHAFLSNLRHRLKSPDSTRSNDKVSYAAALLVVKLVGCCWLTDDLGHGC